MLTYLKRDEKPRPSGSWARLSGLFKPSQRYIEDHNLPQDFSERRLNQRVFAYWEERAEGRKFPRPRDIKGAELGPDWNNCFILDTREDYGYAKFDYLGANLAKFSGVFLSGRAEWTYTVLDKATEQVARALVTQGAVVCDDALTLYDGRVLLFRSVLLPMSENGRTISHLLGAANGKFADHPPAD